MIRRLNAGNRIHFIPGIGIQVITPRAAAKWWLTGGISPEYCIGAYHAGAQNYESSLINLVNPGVFTLTTPDGDIAWEYGVWHMQNKRFYIANVNLPVGTACFAFRNAGGGSGERLLYQFTGVTMWLQPLATYVTGNYSWFRMNTSIPPQSSAACVQRRTSLWINSYYYSGGAPAIGTCTNVWCGSLNIAQLDILCFAFYSVFLTDAQCVALRDELLHLLEV